MNYKTTITYGIILWAIITIISSILHPYITNIIDSSFTTLLLPLSIILVTSFFTVIYIRNFNSNELIEGLKLGIVFSIIDVVGDSILLLLKINYTVIDLYPTYLMSMVVLIILTTTFIGYLAQMPIELR